MDDLRRTIVLRRAQRHLKQQLDKFPITELTPSYHDRRGGRGEVNNVSKRRTNDGGRRGQKNFESYDGAAKAEKFLSYADWRKMEQEKKSRQEEKNRPSKTTHQPEKSSNYYTGDNRATTSNNRATTGSSRTTTKSKSPSVEVICVNNNPKAEANIKRRPSVEFLGAIPPQQSTTHTMTVRQITVHHHQFTR